MIQNCNVLVIDDDIDVAESYRQLLELSGYRPYLLTDAQSALSVLPMHWQGVVICDLYMPSMSGMDLLEHFQQYDPQLPVIMVTGHGDIPLAVEAVKKGAVDFLEKPLDPPRLLALLEHWLSIRCQTVQQRQHTEYAANSLLMGDSPLIKKIRAQIQQASHHHKDILIEGENGTGRRTLAQILHQQNGNTAIFEEIDGATTTERTALEAALQRTEGGDLCLYAPEKLSPALQNWLCQYLLAQDRAGQRKTRLLAVVEGNANHWVESQQLSPELFYLLSQMRFQLPTLRQRSQDIEPLFRHFLTLSCEKLGRSIPNIDASYLETLKRYHWPNNVVELKSLAELYAIGIVKFAGHQRANTVETMSSPLENLIENYEKQIIEDALFLFSGRINEAAEYLQIPRKKLYLRMKKYELDKAQFKANSELL